jgi:glutamate 5-kinase
MQRDRMLTANRVVIKIGTTSLTNPKGGIDYRKIESLAWVLSDIRSKGKEIILVSSGSIAVGAERLKMPERPRDIKGKQAASSVGQAILMQFYENFFMQYNQIVAQILITKDELSNGSRVENAKNTFNTLLSWGVIPIVNENDTISIEELGFSDNDTLSAYVAELVNADVLILLSDIDGLYDSDPNKNTDAKLISDVRLITADVEAAAGSSASDFGTGGMHTKITAAKAVSKKGIATVISSGEDPKILFDILDGKDVGTIIYGA